MSHYFLCSQNKDSINNIFIQLFISDFVAAEFPKTPSPKPAPLHSPHPLLRAGKFSRGFAKSFSPENSFGKTESALKPHALPEYLEGRTPKEKHPFLFQKKFTPAKSKMQGVFFLSGFPPSPRGGGGAFVERTI